MPESSRVLPSTHAKNPFKFDMTAEFPSVSPTSPCQRNSYRRILLSTTSCTCGRCTSQPS